MVTYSVKRVAEILGTNEETVRRWIRSGKLKAEKTSNKEGNVIKEAALAAFAKASPKYASAIAACLSMGTGFGLAAFGLTGAASTILAAKEIENIALEKARVSADSVYSYLAERIRDERSKLEQLLKEQANIEKRIQIESELVERLIEQLNGLDDATINQKIKIHEEKEVKGDES